jgi:heptosyltransferase II
MRVVVRVPNWLGDAVMSLGGLRAIRQIVSSEHLTVLARPSVADVFREAGIADEVLALARGSWRDAVTAARRLRAGRFDAAILFQNAFEAALVARLAGIGRVVGYPTDGRRLLLSDPIPRDPAHRREHQSRYYMHIAAGFARTIAATERIDVEHPDSSLAASPETRARGLEMLAGTGVAPGSAIAVLNAGATNSRAKQWSADRFAAVGDALVERSGGMVVLIGAPGDVDASKRVVDAMKRCDRAVVLAGKTSVAELIGVLSQAWVVVSNDTGPAHVSAALGIPTVTIFGPTEEFATHPVGPFARTVRRPVECSPCMLRDCPIDHRCMTGVSVDDVLGATDAIIASRGPKPRIAG